MITYSIIKKSELEGAMRLDAEYYQPEYLKISNQIKNDDRFISLSQLNIKCDASAFYPALEHYYGQEGIPFVRVADVDDGIDYDNILTIPKEILKKYKTLNTGDAGDIVITKGGSIARVGLISRESALTRDLIFFNTSKLNENDYLFYYIYCLTNFYKNQLIRSSSMTNQPHLTLTLVRDIPFFNPAKNFRNQIIEIFKKSQHLLEESKYLYSQAEKLLLEEAGIKNENIKSFNLYSIVNFSDIQKAKRMDAEYFQNKYGKLVSITDYIFKPLVDVIENVPAKFEPKKESDKQFRYVELSNINASIGIIDGFSEMLGKDAPGRAKRILKEGDVIVSSVEGSLEKVALVHKEQKGFLASTGFFQLRSKEILPEVLLIIAKSIIFQSQLKQRCTGTILTAVPKESIRDILVPIISKPIQQKIAELVRKSHEARRKAKELLEESKIKVEKLIENN